MASTVIFNNFSSFIFSGIIFLKIFTEQKEAGVFHSLLLYFLSIQKDIFEINKVILQ